MNTQMSTNLTERKAFLLPDVVVDHEFSKEELADDMEGLQLGFQRVKIPSGGMLQFELPGDDPDNPEYAKYLEGVIVYSHNSNAYWTEGGDHDDNEPPACQSVDGKLGVGTPAASAPTADATALAATPRVAGARRARICASCTCFRAGLSCPFS